MGRPGLCFFMDFGEEVESKGAGIGNMEEGDVLGGETMEGPLSFKTLCVRNETILL